MEKKINPMLQRLIDFAASKGWFAEIGRKVDKHPSTFYNLIRRDALPSLATLAEIAEAYPEMDMNYMIRGERHINEGEMVELREKVKSYESSLLRLVTSGKDKDAVNPQQEIIGDPYKWTIKSAIMQGVPVADQKNMNSQWFISPIC